MYIQNILWKNTWAGTYMPIIFVSFMLSIVVFVHERRRDSEQLIDIRAWKTNEIKNSINKIILAINTMIFSACWSGFSNKRCCEFKENGHWDQCKFTLPHQPCVSKHHRPVQTQTIRGKPEWLIDWWDTIFWYGSTELSDYRNTIYGISPAVYLILFKNTQEKSLDSNFFLKNIAVFWCLDLNTTQVLDRRSVVSI